MMKGLFFLLALTFLSCQNNKKQTPSPLQAEYADLEKDVVTVNFEGLETYIDRHPSRTLVINFWATWCKPCIAELPAFEKLREAFTYDDVAVILVSLDFPDQLQELHSFIKKKNLQSEIVFLNDGNANEWIPKIDKNWSGAIPATLIRTNKNRSFYEQSFTYEELKKEVLTMIP